jgi:hypothetical protein
MGVEFGEVHPETFRLRVRDGLVACPRLGEVDIACCLECGQLVRREGRREVFSAGRSSANAAARRCADAPNAGSPSTGSTAVRIAAGELFGESRSPAPTAAQPMILCCLAG